MAKVLATAAMVIGAVALVATGVGAAAFGVTLAQAAATVSIGPLTIGAMLGISAGLSVGASLLAKRPSIAGGGMQTDFKADPNAPLPYAIGRIAPSAAVIFRGAVQ